MERESAEAKKKIDAKATERERAWAETEAKEKADISRIDAEAWRTAKAKAEERASVWAEAEESKRRGLPGSLLSLARRPRLRLNRG